MEPTDTDLQELFRKQQQHSNGLSKSPHKSRIRKLTALQKALEGSYRSRIRNALYADFKKPVLETDLTEIYQVVGEIKLVRRNLRTWMERKYVPTPLALTGTSSWYMYEPKGVCLIISPWNFPLTLTLGPLVSAIAAGNTAILKPSELSPNTSGLIAQLVRELFPENEVAVVEGGADMASALLKLPFNHIFFTGSTAIGKRVMQAAAAHLTSVTLELGGKSPAIVEASAALRAAARKIAWGKFLNAGQLCIAPDYILVEESVRGKFLDLLVQEMNALFKGSRRETAPYSRIVNERHFQRLIGYLEDAKKHGAVLLFGGDYNVEDRYISPTILDGLPSTAALLQEEIFGPLLPVLGYGNREDAIAYVNRASTPLAIYIYSRERKGIQELLSSTRAGSSAVNTNMLQYTNHHLPFGGVNQSGMGKSHGYWGFQEFSNKRSVIRQHGFTALELLFPPYTRLKEKLAEFTVKWL